MSMKLLWQHPAPVSFYYSTSCQHQSNIYNKVKRQTTRMKRFHASVVVTTKETLNRAKPAFMRGQIRIVYLLLMYVLSVAPQQEDDVILCPQVEMISLERMMSSSYFEATARLR